MDNERDNKDIATSNPDPGLLSVSLITSLQSSITAAVFFGALTAAILVTEVIRWGISDLYIILISGFTIFSFGTYKKNKASAIMLFLFGALLLLLKYALGYLTPITTVVWVVALYYFLQGAVGVFRINKISNKSVKQTG